MEQLQELTSTSDWSIVIREECLPMDTVARTLYNAESREAEVLINENFHFPGGALLHTLMHELLELELIDLWTVHAEMIQKLQPEDAVEYNKRIRRIRDHIIECRIHSTQFWDEHDIPIPKVASLYG